MLDEFQVDSQNDIFHCSVHPPLAISVKVFKRPLPVGLLKVVLKRLLVGWTSSTLKLR
jgi:hypothetical protein